MKSVTRWLRRHWPNLTMLVAMAVGFGVGVLVLGRIPDATEIGPNLLLLGIAVAVNVVWYCVLAYSGWVGLARPPGIVVWVVGLVVAAALLMVV